MRLSGLSGPPFEAVGLPGLTLKGGRGCICTLTPSSDWLGGSRWCARSRAGCRWWHRWLQAGEEARRTLSCLLDRSSRPHRSPRQLAPELAETICACRRETGWGPRLVAGATGVAHATVWKVLHRAGISRAPRAAREPANRYEWPCPGELLHVDWTTLARFA